MTQNLLVVSLKAWKIQTAIKLLREVEIGINANGRYCN